MPPTDRLYRQIADQLSRMIASGDYPAGGKLPPERELAELLGVSRPSVREALWVSQPRICTSACFMRCSCSALALVAASAAASDSMIQRALITSKGPAGGVALASARASRRSRI